MISKEFDIVFLAAAGFGFLIGQQRNAVGHRDLVVIGMDFRKGEEALAVAAIFDERRLQRGLYARYLREIDISFEWPLGCGLEVEFFDFFVRQEQRREFSSGWLASINIRLGIEISGRRAAASPARWRLARYGPPCWGQAPTRHRLRQCRWLGQMGRR